MKNKLMEYYGKRFTSGSKIALFIVIILFGIFIAFGERNVESDEKDGVEKSVFEERSNN
jgi:hypothetical protein